MTHVHALESAAASQRLAAARQFIAQHASTGDVLIVGASRGAADDFARVIAAERGATVGIHRLSFTQLAARLAAPVLASENRAPATSLGSEAVAARAAFDAVSAGTMTYLAPVASTPGFPKALARTLQELRLARIDRGALAGQPPSGADLATLLDAFDAQFAAASATDRASLLEAATRADDPYLRMPAVLLDVPIESPIELEFVAALLRAARPVLLTLPFGDMATWARLASIGVSREVEEEIGPSDLIALRRSLFAAREVSDRDPAGDVRFFSAPGEGRECVEIARRIVAEAAGGVRFDDIAVFVRAPQHYVGLLEHALRRASVPAYFDRGTRRPHPAGRAFLAVLACAVEKLSARRFAEYLSLGQVPRVEDAAVAPAFVPPDDEVFALRAADADAAERDEQGRAVPAPWLWEHLIVESSVIGGDPSRWHRRLDGLAHQYRIQIAEERRDDPESAKAARIERDLSNLAHLRGFALPIIDRLAAWPASATWGEWLDRFVALAPDVLREPERVLRVIEQLRPMSAIGPVPLDEARDVIAERLQAMEIDPPRSRYGRVFVGSPHQARGRVFRVVFVPGVAERMFPQRPHEDPMLLDAEMRAPLDAGLAVQADRVRAERLLLRLAVGAASERLWLSYPRIEMAESRPRVPSTYALDVMRAITGRVPRYEALQESAAAEGGAGLAWPAPPRPDDAIDELEHDLAVLKELLLVDPPASVRGHAHYLLRLNENLKRSVTARWARGRSQWTPYDGITRVTGMTREMLDSQRLAARPYSLSALQKFASCPYQFLLSAVYRLEPPPDIEPLQKLDPLTRGSIFHECQARFFRALEAEGRLPVREAGVTHAVELLDGIVTAVAGEYREKLAPAIDRVWEDEIADLARDLRVWARRLPLIDGWDPALFEFAFGLHDEGRDPRSVPDAVVVDGRFKLRGSVDLIERRRALPPEGGSHEAMPEHALPPLPPKGGSHAAAQGHPLPPKGGSHAAAAGLGHPLPPGGSDEAAQGRPGGFRLQAEDQLRVTDHKTGRNRTTWKTVIGGGSILQPVLYSMAVEQALGLRVVSGRLSYCTSAGGFVDHEIPINDANRRAALEALEIIDRAIELGFLPAAPDAKACTWCDFRPVCGPDEHARVQRKSQDKLGDLDLLRRRP